MACAEFVEWVVISGRDYGVLKMELVIHREGQHEPDKPISFDYLQYIGSLRELRIYQGNMIVEKTQNFDLTYDLNIYRSFRVSLECCEKPHPCEVHLMGLNDGGCYMRTAEVKFTPLDFSMKWGPKGKRLNYLKTLQKIKYFCIYANPVPPMPKYYDHETLHPLGIQEDTL